MNTKVAVRRRTFPLGYIQYDYYLYIFDALVDEIIQRKCFSHFIFTHHVRSRTFQLFPTPRSCSRFRYIGWCWKTWNNRWFRSYICVVIFITLNVINTFRKNDDVIWRGRISSAITFRLTWKMYTFFIRTIL